MTRLVLLLSCAPQINDPPPACIRTTPPVNFTIAIGDSAGPLFLRDGQFILSPDSLDAPQTIPSGVLYGFLPKASAEDVTVEVPLTGTVNFWSVIDVMCAAEYPDQLPSVDLLDDDGMMIPGAWMAFNFTAERVHYAP